MWQLIFVVFLNVVAIITFVFGERLLTYCTHAHNWLIKQPLDISTPFTLFIKYLSQIHKEIQTARKYFILASLFNFLMLINLNSSGELHFIIKLGAVLYNATIITFAIKMVSITSFIKTTDKEIRIAINKVKQIEKLSTGEHIHGGTDE